MRFSAAFISPSKPQKRPYHVPEQRARDFQWNQQKESEGNEDDGANHPL
jgi:hypothetical protein